MYIDVQLCACFNFQMVNNKQQQKCFVGSCIFWKNQGNVHTFISNTYRQYTSYHLYRFLLVLSFSKFYITQVSGHNHVYILDTYIFEIVVCYTSTVFLLTHDKRDISHFPVVSLRLCLPRLGEMDLRTHGLQGLAGPFGQMSKMKKM